VIFVVLDSAPIARRLAGLGITGVITNRPGWIRARLDSRGCDYS
jgi:hypothetical protein